MRVRGLVLVFACMVLPRCNSTYESGNQADDDDTAAEDDDTDTTDDDTAPADDDSAAVGDDDTAATDDDDTAGSGDDDDTSGPADCSPGPGDGEDCEFLESVFYTLVRDSVLTVVADHPDWFEDHDGWTYAAQPENYMDSVVALLNTQNLCAIRDPNAGDEVAVKHDNAFAESFDILTWEGYVRTGEGIYNATCAPAWF